MFTVSAADGDARTVLFGAEALYRAHPKKHLAHVANALYWGTSEE